MNKNKIKIYIRLSYENGSPLSFYPFLPSPTLVSTIYSRPESPEADLGIHQTPSNTLEFPANLLSSQSLCISGAKEVRCRIENPTSNI
jgi:hypothetical protein